MAHSPEALRHGAERVGRRGLGGGSPQIRAVGAGGRPDTGTEPEFPVHGDERAAAFFDLDNTVMQGAAIFHFGRGLYKRKFFETRDLARFAWQQAWFRLAGFEDPEHMQDARDSALSIVKGHRVSELRSIGEEIYDEYMAERIWPGTRALAQAHLDAGQKVWLVTAAPVEIAQVIARRLGLTGALGTVAESVGGVYTGKLVGEPLHGPAKAEAVRALARRRRAWTCPAARPTATPTTTSRCCPWSATRTPSTRTPSCASTPGSWSGACGTTAPGARRPRSASRRPRASAPWPAAPRRPSRCTVAGADGAGRRPPFVVRRPAPGRPPIDVTYPRDAPSSPPFLTSTTTRSVATRNSNRSGHQLITLSHLIERQSGTEAT